MFFVDYKIVTFKDLLYSLGFKFLDAMPWSAAWTRKKTSTMMLQFIFFQVYEYIDYYHMHMSNSTLSC